MKLIQRIIAKLDNSEVSHITFRGDRSEWEELVASIEEPKPVKIAKKEDSE